MNRKQIQHITAAVCFALLTSCSSGGSSSSSRITPADNGDGNGVNGDGNDVTPVVPTVPIMSVEQLQILSRTSANAETSAGVRAALAGAVGTAPARRGFSGISGLSGLTSRSVNQANSTAAVAVSPMGNGQNFIWGRSIEGGGSFLRTLEDPASNSLGDLRTFVGLGPETTDGGRYYASFITDYVAGDNIDSDYLAAGFWIFVPGVQSNSDDYLFGVFSGGNQPFDFSSAVTGSATYSGKATGICNCEGTSGTQAIRVFEANALLNTNFTDNTISGSITGFVVDGDALTGDQVRTVSLMNGTINNTGFFTGMSSLNASDNHGSWGGEFYGVSNNDILLPGSAGGTFGADDSTETFVGAFGAHLDR